MPTRATVRITARSCPPAASARTIGRVNAVATSWSVAVEAREPLYDADGELLIRRNNATDGETVLYLGATEVHLKTGKKWANRYYTAAGATIALCTNESGTRE
ncbi:hypothetical protein SAMN02787118_12941 [Streptomyces mirabilis]|jgi:hypothetical protein|uniref:Uncharacterized protein n=1 Tax=Streptomyces mirabilis TaxID=68239 RepID=A0A1I2UVI0_9ACTN|nr:hypothetical protein SAMN02787118_12941 [Streptomyces mirabilis]